MDKLFYVWVYQYEYTYCKANHSLKHTFILYDILFNELLNEKNIVR